MSEIYKQLADAVVNMKPKQMKELAQRALDEGCPAEEAIEKGLVAGMNEVGRLFAAHEYFVPEMLVCAKSLYTGFEVLKPKVLEGKLQTKGTIAIGVVDGDFHDIGKNIVKLLLEASGFKIIDLGKNVPLSKFEKALVERQVHIVALSTLMTTTMDNMEEIVLQIKKKNPGIKLMVGGAPVNEDFADQAGAHFYGENAKIAVQGAHKLLGLNYEG